MAKIYSVHEIDLLPGVTTQQFEEFVARRLALPNPPGMTVLYLRGDRGERSGKYIHLVEFESAERRDELYPADGSESAEILQYRDPALMAQIVAEWRTLATIPGETSYTDYVEIEQALG